jgi:Protein of unknown function (DUF3151)
VSDPSHKDLLATGPGPVPTRLPEDPAAAELAGDDGERFLEIVANHPASSLCWALLAESALQDGNLAGDLGAYAYARTGYHRGLDLLRRSGWRGSGPIPWEHEANRGFLRSLYALAGAAERIGEAAEHERCLQFLRDSSATAYAELAGRSQVSENSPGDRPQEVR